MMTTPRKKTLDASLDASLVRSAELICDEYKAEVRPAFNTEDSVYIVRVNDNVAVLLLSNSTKEDDIRMVLNGLNQEE